jgi:hypothetical protein
LARESGPRAEAARYGDRKLGTIPKILGKFGGIKSQRLATNPRRFCGDLDRQVSLHGAVRSPALV